MYSAQHSDAEMVNFEGHIKEYMKGKYHDQKYLCYAVG